MKKLGIIIYDGVQAMDVFGPWEVFGVWRKLDSYPLQMSLISVDGQAVQADNDILINAHCAFDEVSKLDYLIIPGGQGRVNASSDVRVLSFIQAQAQNCQYILSVCTGVFLLHYAGLLNGRFATTYWRAIPELESLNSVVIDEQRIVKSGNIWSAGGISSGIDLAFELIAEIAGKDEAGMAQLLFEYFPNHTKYAKQYLKDQLPNYNQITTSCATCLPKYIQQWMIDK